MGQSASAKIFYGILIFDEYNWSDNYDVFKEEYELDAYGIINEFGASDVLDTVYYGYEYGAQAIALKREGDNEYNHKRYAKSGWVPEKIPDFLSNGCGYSEGFFDHGQEEPEVAAKLKEIVTALREKGFEIADPTWYLAASYG